MFDAHDFLYIGGEWTKPSSDRRISVVSPNTAQPLGTVAEAMHADVDCAVAAARRAFDDRQSWRDLAPTARAAGMRRFADAIDSRKDALTQAVSAQNGMPISIASQLEGVYPSTMLRYYADMLEAQVEDVRDGAFGGKVRVLREPHGVVAAIAPWNAPQTLAMLKIAPALAAGCTVVLKPSPETVFDSVLLAEAAMEAELPLGVLNIVPAGREVGEHLVSHPGVDMVAFTGSTQAGRRIGEICGRLLRPVSLELGGKSAAIILNDFALDLNTFADAIFLATMTNNGQTCFLCTRVLAPQSRYGEVVDFLSDFAGSMTIGDSLAPDTQIGPLATSRQLERVQGYIAQGRSEGGRVTCGGRRVDRDGWFVEPTVFADVDNNATISREEIFGPVLTVIPYRDEQDAIGIANDSEYGLAGSVWTSDPERGLRVARQVETGAIGVNRLMPDPVAPFGGVKSSGHGRDYGPEGLAEYQWTKSIFC